MVHGNALIEMGEGSTMMTPFAWDNGVGGLALNTVEPGAIGRTRPTPEDWRPDDGDVLITFENEESLMGFIKSLQEVQELMKKVKEDLTENTAEYPYTITREYDKNGTFTEYKED